MLKDSLIFQEVLCGAVKREQINCELRVFAKFCSGMMDLDSICAQSASIE